MAPKPEKTRVRTHRPKHGTDCLHGQKCDVRTPFSIGPFPFFFCRVNGLIGAYGPAEVTGPYHFFEGSGPNFFCSVKEP